MPVGKDVQPGKYVRILHPDLVNLYGCVVGDETRIGTFVEVQVSAKIVTVFGFLTPIPQ